jgi:signal transduction histidine kinase
VLEEVEETQGRFLAVAGDDGDEAEREARVLAVMDALTAIMQRQVSDRPQAWRVWRGRDRALIGEFGSAELLALVPAIPEDRRLAAGLRWRVAPLSERYTLGLAMDGRERFAELRREALEVVALALGSTLIALAAGALLGRRIANDLERVAREIRLDTGAEPPQSSDAPLEVVGVLDALRTTLARVRAEIENGRLISSGMAHELRSPLQNLMGEAQVALLRERTNAEYRAVLESQLEELNELSRVVDNLVTLSSVESGRRPVTIEIFDLAAELRLRLTREFRLAQRRGVELLLEGDVPLLLEGDREALVLAVRNVVTNAIEWTPRGRVVALGLGTAGDELEIVVDDAGPGVPPEEREAIFRPFHRGQAAVGRRVGFGIGLALTRRAVTDQGGTIEVGESELGGSRFRLRLPRRRPS